MTVWPLPRLTVRELSSIEETRAVALLTSEDVWARLGDELDLPILIQAEPPRYDRELFHTLAEGLPSRVEVVYAVGNGSQIDAAKIIAGYNDVPLVIVPTMLDHIRMLSPDALVESRDEGVVRYTETPGPADEVILDWSLIQSAPADQRAAGIVDILSVVTGLLDWRYSAQRGKNPRSERFVPWVAGTVTGLVKEAIKNAGAMGTGEPEALEELLNLMMIATQVCNQFGHRRAIEGGEHYLADIFAAATGSRLPHAERVGPSILFVTALHGQSPDAVKVAMEQAGVRLDQIKPTDFHLAIERLPTLIDSFSLPYSILNDLDPSSEQVANALEVAGLAIQPETWEFPAGGDTQPASDDVPLEAPVDNKEVMRD